MSQNSESVVNLFQTKINNITRIRIERHNLRDNTKKNIGYFDIGTGLDDIYFSHLFDKIRALITRSERTYDEESNIGGSHNIDGSQTVDHGPMQNNEKQIIGYFKTSTGLKFKFSIAICDTADSTCRIAFAFYNLSFDQNKSDSEIGIIFRLADKSILKRFSTKDIFLFTYNSSTNSVEQHERFNGIGNGIIRFLNKDELIILRRNDFRIIQIYNRDLGIRNAIEVTRSFFNQSTTTKRTNIDHAYPPPMHKFEKYKISGEIDSKPKDNKIKRYEILPTFAVSTKDNENDESQYLAATMGDNSFTIYFLPNSINLTTRKLPNKHAKIKFMAFIAKNTKLLIEIWIWNMPGTSNFEDSQEKRLLEYTAEKLNIKIEERDQEYFTLKFNDVDNLEFFKVKNNIYFKEDENFKLFYSCINSDSNNAINKSPGNNSLSNLLSENSEELDSASEFINNDDEMYNITNINFNKEQIEIRVSHNIIQIWIKNENLKTLRNIWSIPPIFSKYLKDSIILKDDSLVNEPHAMSILGMISALKLLLKQKQGLEKEKAAREKEMNDVVSLNNKIAELKDLLQNIKQQLAPDIIEKAIIKKDDFRILDVRFHIVATMIEADLIAVVREKIVINPKLRLHIPEQVIQHQNNEIKYNFVCFLPKPIVNKEYRSALMIASDHSQHDTVESLLNYYSANAESEVNWMETVTQALPELITKYPKLVNELMKNKIFHQKEIPLDKSWKFYRPPDKYDSVRSFHCEFNLFNSFRQEQLELLEKEKQNHSSQYRKTNTKYHQVPLPGVIQGLKKRYNEAILDYIYNFILNLIFLERNRGTRSPFIYLVTRDITGEIFDNPSIEAIVDCQWRHYARAFIIIRFLLYVLYAILFLWQSYAHLNKIVYGGTVGALFKPISGIMCGVAYIDFTEKVRRGRYIPWSQHLPSILYVFDLFGSTLPFFGSAWMLWVHTHYVDLLPFDEIRNESLYCQQYTEQCQVEVIFYSLAGLLLWVVFVILPNALLATLLLLRFAPGIGVFPQPATFNGHFTDPNNRTAHPDFNMKQKLDWTDRSDNYFYEWDKSIEAVYFWISGRWDQIDNWEFWPVDLVTMLGSIFLATLMQNLLIGLMGKALDETALEKRAVVQMRAHLLINYPDAFSQIRHVYYSIPGKELKKLRKKIKEEISDESYEENPIENPTAGLESRKTESEKQPIENPTAGLESRMAELENSMKGLETSLSKILEKLNQIAQ
ncbi:4031_t:CDS:2 [Ambispora gerdemannii]|uniref:4031_t:CDS:1 n=1 Tax=Ambispora gerdemannii TaxID=144530 RepID=A0A9N8ZNW3_9GLOM|nr:4031_t:CDS:2 [Ambispora gerdemannii]